MPLYCRICGIRMPSDSLFCPTCGVQQAEIDHALTSQSEQNPALLGTGRLPVGQVLNRRYRVVRTVGQGGMGAVYAAQDIQLGDRLVAVKEMSMRRIEPQEVPQAVGQFQHEAYLLASLHHPNLPAIHEYFREDDRWYLVMSFIEGRTLQAVLNAAPGKKLPVAEAVRIGIELCEVLDYLHTHKPQIIFRDLKPLNIMVTPKGHICLIDFGIARHFKPGQTQDTAHYYSIGYAPPEQYGQSQTGLRSDVYSLGATLHQMLSGQHPVQKPFQFSPLQPLNQTISDQLATLVAQMVEMSEQARPSSVVEVKARLQSALTSTPEPTPRGGAEHGAEHLKLSLSKSPGPMSSESVPDGPEQTVAETAKLFTHTNPSETAEPGALTFPPLDKTPVPSVLEASTLTPAPLPSRDTPLHRARSAFPDKGNQPFTKRENVPLRKANAQRQAEGTTRLSRSWDKKSIALTSFLVVLAALLAVTVISPYLRGSTSSGQSTPSSLTPSSSPTVDVTAVAAYNRYVQAISGAPTFFEPLDNETDSGNNWFVGEHNGIGKCYFENQAYHVTAYLGYIHTCDGPPATFSDFAFQVQITFVQGDAGGFFFRADSSKSYAFYVGPNGTYRMTLSDNGQTTDLSHGENPAISTGQGQQDLISALIQNNRFDFFVNNQYITSISDNIASQGATGLIAASFSASPANIAYQNMKVWNLP